MMRALPMDFVTDKKTWNINNQYMFGKSLLVCPVTDSLYTSRAAGDAVADFSKTKTQKVYLPQGAAWYDFWTGAKTAGGQDVEKEVPVDIMPLYVKAGSMLPMGPFQQYAGEKDTAALELRVYEGADGTFTLYEDENDNYNYEKGRYATIAMKWNDKSRVLTIGDRKGDFMGMVKNKTINVVLVNTTNGQGIAMAEHITKVVHYTGKATIVKL